MKFQSNRPMKHYISYPLVFSAILISLTACSAFPPSNPAKPTPNVQNLPLYPNAQKIAVQDLPGGRSSFKRLTSFETNDKPEEVLAFYRNVLSKEGWEPMNQPTQQPDMLIFDWGNGVGQPGYRMAIVVKPPDSGLTLVEVTVTKDDPK